MFYISPFNRTPIAFFSGIYDNFGWIASMSMFIVALLLGASIVYYFSYFWRVYARKKKQKGETVEERILNIIKQEF